jgi:hypothetical protein
MKLVEALPLICYLPLPAASLLPLLVLVLAPVLALPVRLLPLRQACRTLTS